MRVDEENAKHYNKLSVLSMTKMISLRGKRGWQLSSRLEQAFEK